MTGITGVHCLAKCYIAFSCKTKTFHFGRKFLKTWEVLRGGKNSILQGRLLSNNSKASGRSRNSRFTRPFTPLVYINSEACRVTPRQTLMPCRKQRPIELPGKDSVACAAAYKLCSGLQAGSICQCRPLWGGPLVMSLPPPQSNAIVHSH